MTPPARNHVRIAVIPAAGLGTRFLPFTKAMPKEMLPVVDKPAIQYVVEEAAEAGIEEILIITSASKKSVEDHFDRAIDLETHLLNKAKVDEADQIKAIAELARIYYLRQGEALGLGHAIGLARHYVGDEPFLVMSPDNLMAPATEVVKTMIDVYHDHRCSVVALEQVPLQQIANYGSVIATQVDDELYEVSGVVEKPAPEDAPSNLAVMGRYLFTPEIFDRIEETKPGLGGEYQIADAMNSLLDSQPMMGCDFTGSRFDTGDKLDYLRAVVEFALQRQDLGADFRALLAVIAEREGI